MTAMDTFIRGKIHPFDRLYSRREIYTGTPAKMMAFAILLFGLGLLGYSAVEFASPGKAARNVKDLLNTPHGGGVTLLIFGFFMLLFGIIRLIAGSAHPMEQRSSRVDSGFRAGGLITERQLKFCWQLDR